MKKFTKKGAEKPSPKTEKPAAPHKKPSATSMRGKMYGKE